MTDADCAMLDELADAITRRHLATPSSEYLACSLKNSQLFLRNAGIHFYPANEDELAARLSEIYRMK